MFSGNRSLLVCFGNEIKKKQLSALLVESINLILLNFVSAISIHIHICDIVGFDVEYFYSPWDGWKGLKAINVTYYKVQ